MKRLYVSAGIKLIFEMFEENAEENPMGWTRVSDLLKNKEELKKFKSSEIQELKDKLLEKEGSGKE